MAVTPPPPRASTYLEHLPAVFREEAAGDPGFLGRFLLAFEHLLTGVGDPDVPGLDERVDRVLGRGLAGADRGSTPTYFDPTDAVHGTPAPFLDWLSGWVAFTLRGDLDAGDVEQRPMARRLVADAVRIYRRRGTRQGLRELITLLSGGLAPTITEPGVPDADGVAPAPEGVPPHFFHILLRLPHADPEERRRVVELVRALVDVEKPAHTVYTLDVRTPAMQIGVHSRVGVETLLVPPAPPGTPP